MKSPLHAAHYADQCVSKRAVVQQRKQLAEETYMIRMECAEIARRITPGQFLMVRIPDSAEPLLGRAFAMYDVGLDGAGRPNCVDIAFAVVGKITRCLARARPGDELEIWGPLGNGFQPQETQHLVMVAGGIGQTPFLAVGKEHRGVQAYGITPRNVKIVRQVTLCYGARNAARLAGIEDFRANGIEVHVATDDGSMGHHGVVTYLLEHVLRSSTLDPRVVCCGPESMMAATGTVCRENQVNCEVSLETPMACGLGICFSCVTKVSISQGKWDYRRTCVDGPVFNEADLVW